MTTITDATRFTIETFTNQMKQDYIEFEQNSESLYKRNLSVLQESTNKFNRKLHEENTHLSNLIKTTSELTEAQSLQTSSKLNQLEKKANHKQSELIKNIFRK